MLLAIKAHSMLSSCPPPSPVLSSPASCLKVLIQSQKTWKGAALTDQSNTIPSQLSVETQAPNMKDKNKICQLGLGGKFVLDLSLPLSTQKKMKSNQSFPSQLNQCIGFLSTHLVPFPKRIFTYFRSHKNHLTFIEIPLITF